MIHLEKPKLDNQSFMISEFSIFVKEWKNFLLNFCQSQLAIYFFLILEIK